MNSKTLFVAFSTQKGGVGKTTFTVLAASYLHYLKGYNVAVVDCDYPQHSITAMRKRDSELVNSNQLYKLLAYNQFKALNKKAYPILCATSGDAITIASEYIKNHANEIDVVFFDLPGTVNSEGVIGSLASMDYIFTPITADRVVLESTLSFAMTINNLLVQNDEFNLKGLHLFWNQVDKRERTDLYEVYEKTISDLELNLMTTYIPDTKRYKKELFGDKPSIFRSTLFPADKRLMRGSNLEDLITEIGFIIKL